MIIVSAAPIIIRRDAVENKPTLDLVERVLSDFLTKTAQMIRKIYRIRRTATTPSRSGTILLKLKFDVCGVMPESDEIDESFPFQVG